MLRWPRYYNLSGVLYRTCEIDTQKIFIQLLWLLEGVERQQSPIQCALLCTSDKGVSLWGERSLCLRSVNMVPALFVLLLLSDKLCETPHVDLHAQVYGNWRGGIPATRLASELIPKRLLLSQRFPHFFCQVIQFQWFLNKHDTFIQHPVMGDDV